MKTKFERVSLLPPYVFSEINNLKAKERLKGRDIIDLGNGSILMTLESSGSLGLISNIY